VLGGAVTFVRPSPGFCYVIQDIQGRLRTGTGMTVARRGEVFKQFVDRSFYSRTTKPISAETADRQTVTLRVLLQWRIENARLWLRLKGAERDLFEAVEESIQSIVRDIIARFTYLEIMEEQRNRLPTLVSALTERISSRARLVGGRILGVLVREFRFKQIALSNESLSNKTAIAAEQKQFQLLTTQLQQEKFRSAEAKKEYDMRVEKIVLNHNAVVRQLRDDARLEHASAPFDSSCEFGQIRNWLDFWKFRSCCFCDLQRGIFRIRRCYLPE